jgi:phosphohistidine phosphatase
MRVILVRHAHAEWPDYQGRDFDRPLTKQGLEQAEVTAHAIAGARERPQRIIASPALRTRQTAEVIARALSLSPKNLELIPALYNAGHGVLERQIKHESGGPLILVAHNPGITDLARHLSAEPLRAYFQPGEWQSVELAAARLKAL